LLFVVCWLLVGEQGTVIGERGTGKVKSYAFVGANGHSPLQVKKISLFTIYYLLFTIYYLLFTIHYSLFTLHLCTSAPPLLRSPDTLPKV